MIPQGSLLGSKGRRTNLQHIYMLQVERRASNPAGSALAKEQRNSPRLRTGKTKSRPSSGKNNAPPGIPQPSKPASEGGFRATSLYGRARGLASAAPPPSANPVAALRRPCYSATPNCANASSESVAPSAAHTPDATLFASASDSSHERPAARAAASAPR